MFQNSTALVYVDSNRLQGVSKKTGNDYDMATIELSDGIASFELPLEPLNQKAIKDTFHRGQPVVATVDVKKQFGKAQLIVTKVDAAIKK